MDAAVEEIRDLLRRRRKVADKPDNFGISTSDQILTQFAAITGGIFALMVAISSVGLLIGGIGVMNIMLVSVTERTREIGVRKAIGARRRDIVAQFLIEAGTLTGLGGLLGIIVGSGLALLIQMLMPTHSALGADRRVCCFRGVGSCFWIMARLESRALESHRSPSLRVRV